MASSESILDQEPYASEILYSIAKNLSNSSVQWELGHKYDLATSEAAIRRFKKRHALQIAALTKDNVTLNPDDTELLSNEISMPVTKSPPSLGNTEQMLKDRNLDPDKWEVDSITSNSWQGPSENGTVTYYQDKLHIRNKKSCEIVPARSDGWQAPRGATPNLEKPYTVVICSDAHAPFYDRKLHNLFCGWLEDIEPAEGICAGDLFDAPTISTHRSDPENHASINECIQSGYDVLRGYVAASPGTSWKYIPGNHDYDRLRNYPIDNARNLYGIRRANDIRSVLSIPHLLRLDELNIKFVEPSGSYELSQVVINDNLVIKHGEKVGKESGQTALKMLDQYNHSIMVGHCHRQALVYKTLHKATGEPKILAGVELGCMCSIDQRADFDGRKFPAYSSSRSNNWQNGFATVNIYPDGLFKIDLATYFDGVLLWRDRRYE